MRFYLRQIALLAGFGAGFGFGGDGLGVAILGEGTLDTITLGGVVFTGAIFGNVSLGGGLFPQYRSSLAHVTSDEQAPGFGIRMRDCQECRR